MNATIAVQLTPEHATFLLRLLAREAMDTGSNETAAQCEAIAKSLRLALVRSARSPGVPVLPKRRIEQLIYLTGARRSGYTVVLSGFDGATDLPVPSTRIGNAIVAALRHLAAVRTDLFPPSKLE